jgi:amino acid transporter
VSIVAILVVIGAVLADKGFSAVPFAPPEGLTVSGVAGGMVLAILGYVGYESAACMGTEARSAARSIPRALIGSLLIVAVLYVISSYAQIVGFGDPAKISASPAPLNSLADASGVPVLGYLIDIGAAVSFFACVTGSLNAASRLLYSMGRSRLLHRSIGTAHPRRQTPHLAILALSVICAVIAIVLTLSGIGIMNVFAYTGTVGAYGYISVYVLVAVGAPLYLLRVNAPVAATAMIGGLATIGMAYVLFRNLYPVPAAPYNVLPWIFLGVLAAAGIWYMAVRSRASTMALHES